MKKLISFMMALLMIVTVGASTKVDAKSNPVSFSKKYITLNVGKSTNMKSFLKNAGKSKVIWKTSNSKVASVSGNGVVRARKAGTATIRAYVVKTKKTVSCKVTVKKATKQTKKSGRYRTMRVKCTAYCPCRSCSGGYGTRTASGRRAIAGRTIAVDRRVIPLGSKVVIDGHTYIAEDTGVKGRTIDIYMNSHSKTNQWGVRYKTVKIYY